MVLERKQTRCLVRPEDIAPSNDEMKVVGTFNPGAISTGNGDEVALFVRVAEAPAESRPGYRGLPRWDLDKGGIVIDWVPEEDLFEVDSRVVQGKKTGLIRLTFVSHLQVVMSPDGLSIDDFSGTRFDPGTPWEVFGVEDPRITKIDERFYITYVAVSSHGPATALASTTDFKTFERHGIIFPNENKDVVLFPGKVNGRYVAFHRPSGGAAFCRPEMWLAWSDDLIHWGGHEPFMGGTLVEWSNGRIGAGAPPFLTDKGWVGIYHGSTAPKVEGDVGVYSGGALLLDADDPRRVIAASDGPIMSPGTDFEMGGFVSDVVFPTGIVERGDSLLVYYGAADTSTAVMELDKSLLMNSLK